MRGEDIQQNELFSYGSLEERVPGNHPLRPIRQMVEEALKGLSQRFDEIYDEDGRKSIPPERLLRALLLQLLYSIRSERMLMEQLEYNLLFRWFVGLSANEQVWHATVFTKNRDRLLEGVVAEEFLALVVEQARARVRCSSSGFPRNPREAESLKSRTAITFRPGCRTPSRAKYCAGFPPRNWPPPCDR